MIDEKEKLSLNVENIGNMTHRHDTTEDKQTNDIIENKLNNNNNEKEINGNKKSILNRSLDLPKYGAIRKSLSPEKFILDSPVSDLPTPVNEDAETTEFWSKLRCGSLRTEEVAEREKQKLERQKQRASRQSHDYPGLAFGSAMFGSDTTMKFNIIKNELHNIMRSQLKRVDGEMNAFSSRVKEFDKHLEESEAYIRQATSALAEVVALQAEEDKSKNEDTENESNLSAFDQHVLFLETQLRDAKMKASHSFQILEDCDQAQEELFINSTPMSSPAVTPSDPSRTVADTLSKSSIVTTTVGQCDNNGNNSQPTVSHLLSSQTKEIADNIANGNISEDVTNGNDIANGNTMGVTGVSCHTTLSTLPDNQDLSDENIRNGNNLDIYNSLRVENSKIKTEVFKSNLNSNANCFNTLLNNENSANANLPL